MSPRNCSTTARLSPPSPGLPHVTTEPSPFNAAKAKSVLKGSPTPSIDDVKAAINPVLRHRIILNFNAEAEGIKVDDILEELVKELDV